MRYRLRTLLIVLGVAPPILALAWWTAAYVATLLPPGSLANPEWLLGVVPLGIVLVVVGGFLSEAIVKRSRSGR